MRPSRIIPHHKTRHAPKALHATRPHVVLLMHIPIHPIINPYRAFSIAEEGDRITPVVARAGAIVHLDGGVGALLGGSPCAADVGVDVVFDIGGVVDGAGAVARGVGD